MDAVLNLMNVYNVPDSSTGVEGMFNNEDLQVLYDILVEMGSVSLADRVYVVQIPEMEDVVVEPLSSDNEQCGRI